MRNVYKVLAYLLAVEVVVQAMAIAYAIAGLGKWVADDGGVLNKQVIDSDSPDFPGVGGFATHGINGMMIIPLVVLLLLIVSFFAKIPGGVQKAAILLGSRRPPGLPRDLLAQHPVRRRAARAERVRHPGDGAGGCSERDGRPGAGSGLGGRLA